MTRFGLTSLPGKRTQHHKIWTKCKKKLLVSPLSQITKNLCLCLIKIFAVPQIQKMKNGKSDPIWAVVYGFKNRPSAKRKIWRPSNRIMYVLKNLKACKKSVRRYYFPAPSTKFDWSCVRFPDMKSGEMRSFAPFLCFSNAQRKSAGVFQGLIKQCLICKTISFQTVYVKSLYRSYAWRWARFSRLEKRPRWAPLGQFSSCLFDTHP